MCVIKMKKLMVLSVLVAFFSGCHTEPTHIQAADKFAGNFTKKMAKKHHIFVMVMVEL